MREETARMLSGSDQRHQETKVLYIAGWGRSGSTILGRILGQIEGFFSVGEARYIWDRGVIENRLCSCGNSFRDCPVWGKVVSRVLSTNGGVTAEELVDLRERGLRTRHLLLEPTSRRLQTRVTRMNRYVQALEKLYPAVQEGSGSRVIVDTSKFPSYAHLLRNTPGIKLYLLHLVRDPRAVAYSWASRRKPELDRGDGTAAVMAPHGLVESSLIWNEWNFAIERAWRTEPERYMLLKYEDFVERPRTAVKSILEFMGEEGAEAPFSDEREIMLESSHAFSGNPNRFRNGAVKIQHDEEWKHRMGVARRAAVTALTLPALAHYGYGLRP